MISISVINILGVAVLAVMLAHWYTPIQRVKRWIISKVFRDGYIIDTVFNCSKCSGFLLGIVFFLDLPTAALTSILAYFMNHLIDRVESYYE